jgi:1-acyl-sn-glycerol-3-phosphate acyltransferase
MIWRELMLHYFFRWLIDCIVDLTCVVQIIGFENIPERGGCIVTSNHLGRLDVLLGYRIVRRKDIILTIAEKYERFWFVRIAANAINAIFIDRFKSDLGTLRKVLKRLQSGEILIIAPEGTRSKGEILLEAKQGAAYLAGKTSLPVIPVALTGTEDRIVRANLRRFKRSNVKVIIGKPFYLPPLNKKNRQDCLLKGTEEIMIRIAQLLPEKYWGYYSEHPRLHELIRETEANAIRVKPL